VFRRDCPRFGFSRENEEENRTHASVVCAAIKIRALIFALGLRHFLASKTSHQIGSGRRFPDEKGEPTMPAISPISAPVATGSLPVGIYARVSTFNQVGGRFDSCESQAVMCRDYLNKHAAAEGWHEFITLTDAAYSGANMNRPGMQALMHHIETGAVKVVLIFKLERVLRSTHEWVPFRALLRKHGCRLVSATEDISDETPSGRLKNKIVMSVNEYERDNTAEKIHLKLVEQAKRGMWTGGNVPYGYVFDAELQGLKPQLEEATVLRRIYEQAARLVPLTEIAEQINETGHRTRTRTWRSRHGIKYLVGEKRFRTDILRRLIMRPLYAGRVRMHGVEYPGQHEAIVSQDLWERANAAITQVLQPARCRLRARDKHFHVLKGIVLCGCCGRAMVPNASGKRDPSGQLYRYYTCGHAHKDRTDARCPVRHVSASALEAAVIGFLGECSQHPDVLGATSAQAQRRAEAERTPLRAKLTELDRTLADLTQQLRHCAQAVARGGIDFLGDELRQEAAALHQKRQTLMVEREQARQDLAACEQRSLDPERVRRSLARFGELMPTLSPEQQRDLLLLFLERVEVRPAVKPAPDSCARHIELRLKVRVHRLIEGMEERLVIDAGDRRALPAVAATRPLLLQTDVAVRQAGGVALLSPFARTLLTSKRTPTPRPAPAPVQHPLHRARAWQRRLEAEPKLKRIDLAKAEGLTPGAITHCLKLLQLVPAIQERLLNLSTPAEMRRFSLNQMKALAELPPDEQLLRFAALENAS
jgi:DNA invertase Pin-like site-specific DNA recombinase